MANCSECTFLNPDKCYSDGTFWCDTRLECVFANNLECYRFCRAYKRPKEVSLSCEEFSRNKQTIYNGCYLTTMMCNILKMPDNNPFLESIRSLRENVLKKDEKYKRLLVEYDIIGPIIANNLNNDPKRCMIAARGMYKYIKPITKLIREKEYDQAVNAYLEMTNKLKLFYNIEMSLDDEIIAIADIKKSGHGIYKVKKITLN